MADLAIGMTACLAFRANLWFKAAAITAASVFLLGDAVGHVREMVTAGHFQPGNAGVRFYTDVLCPTAGDRAARRCPPRRHCEPLNRNLGLVIRGPDRTRSSGLLIHAAACSALEKPDTIVGSDPGTVTSTRAPLPSSPQITR